MPATSRATSPSDSAGRGTTVAVAARPASRGARGSSGGWSRSRQVATTRARAAGSRRARNSSSCNDGGSAHWRSSRTTTSGPSSAAASSTAVTSSSSRKRAAASRRSPGSWTRERSTWTQGQYAGAPSPCQPHPQTTRAPPASAWAAAAAATEVLPIPASPVSSTSRPRPRPGAVRSLPGRHPGAILPPPAGLGQGGPGRRPSIEREQPPTRAGKGQERTGRRCGCWPSP
jgi:hypothetical protein